MGLNISQSFLLSLVLVCLGVYITPDWTEGFIAMDCSGSISARRGPTLTASGLLEPMYVQLRPTISQLPCNLTLERSGPLSGYLKQSGNCQGFIGSVILFDDDGDRRQAAEIALPNKITWRAEMENVSRALLTVYNDVLPHELLQDVEWVVDDAILYYPKVTAVNASVIDEPDHQTPAAASLVRYDRNVLQQDESAFWENHTLRDVSRKFNLSCYHSAPFSKIWIVGTSESRALFKNICSAIFKTAPLLEKTTMNAQCGDIHFVNTCQWGCGCDFTNLFESIPDLPGQLISVSCGLHFEYLKNSSYIETTMRGLSDWALRLKQNQSRVQFRVSNAVNPFKTFPKKLAIARNNFKYRMFRDVARSTLLGSDVHVMDAFRVTEPIFDLSSDHVHFHPWVYGELARMFLRSLCNVYLDGHP